jgi:hypothetical protein
MEVLFTGEEAAPGGHSQEGKGSLAKFTPVTFDFVVDCSGSP